MPGRFTLMMAALALHVKARLLGSADASPGSTKPVSKYGKVMGKLNIVAIIASIAFIIYAVIGIALT